MPISIGAIGANANDTEGGERTVAGFGIGAGKAVLVVLQGTNTKTTVAASTNAVVLLASRADQSRVGAKIVNGGSTTLHVELPSGMHDVAANGSLDVDENFQGEVSGWWDAGATGSAYVSEVTV